MEKITTINDLHLLRLKILGFYTNPKPGQYVFQLPQLSDEENNRYSTFMNNYSKSDGYNTGGLAISIVFVITITYYFVSVREVNSIAFSEYISFAAINICAALAGKLFGLIRARWKMLLLVSSLISKTSNTMIIS